MEHPIKNGMIFGGKPTIFSETSILQWNTGSDVGSRMLVYGFFFGLNLEVHEVFFVFKDDLS